MSSIWWIREFMTRRKEPSVSSGTVMAVCNDIVDENATMLCFGSRGRDLGWVADWRSMYNKLLPIQAVDQ